MPAQPNQSTLRYSSGEEIKKGDCVRFHGQPAQIEFIAINLDDSETGWYVKQYGGGAMVSDNTAGSTFISADQISDTEDLEFVSRADAS